MRHIFILLLPIFCLLSSCFHEDEYVNTKQGNFEALWKIMDEHYCFFDYKNVDWNAVHTSYSARISENMSNDAFFELMKEMLATLQDGHVNMGATHDVARYWSWKEDWPQNFREDIQRNYLGTDYGIASGLKYKILTDNIGYISYSSFSSGLGDGNLDQVLSRMAVCDGIIIDIRDNGGGLLTNSDKLASRFFNDKTLVGYIQYKTGKGHNDFSKPTEKYIEPSDRIRYQKKVIVLTNRSCYSSANDFVNAMRYAPNTTIMGDQTGGGSGLPFSSELPNGWWIRFSASPMFDAQMNQIEFGIQPTIKVDMTQSDMDKGIDTIIETAREHIKK